MLGYVDRLTSSFGADHAQLFAVGMTVVVMLANSVYGWDRHEWDIPIEQIADANKIAFVAKLTFTLAATFTRISLICFYLSLIHI